MIALERLLKQLEARGLGVIAGNEPGQLLLTGPREHKTDDVLAAVKAFKPQLLLRIARRDEPLLEDHIPPSDPEPP